jgi:2-polyprenyl-3-methyl-5-hydroxy-6-metoxy-1,4-benzoquinol methylase
VLSLRTKGGTLEEKKEKFKQWQETQEHWDDTEFLAKEANALMKKRWLRLNSIVSKITADEVVLRNEYVSFLDIGAGRGEFYRAVADMVKKYKGLEPSVEMLKDELVDEEYEIKHGTGEDLSEENTYDMCLLKEVLDHTYEPDKVLQNSYKALKEGGLIIITLTNRDSYYKLIFKNKAKELIEKNKDHLHNFNPGEVKELLTKAGFKIEKDLSINYLKLPWKMEEAIGKGSEKFIFGLLDFTDRLFSGMFPGRGGGFIITARKGAAPGEML